MTPRGFAALLFMEGIVVCILVGWAVGLSVWESAPLGALLGLIQAAIIVIGHERSWLRPELFGKKKREAPKGRVTAGLLAYCLGLSMVGGVFLGLVSGYSLAVWIVWLPMLVLLGVLSAFILARAG